MPIHCVVIPLLNEEAVIAVLIARLEKLAKSLLPDTTEFIFVNDGSTDQTAFLLDKVAQDNSAYKVIHLSRNFGHQIAITAGIEHASGDTVTIIDADLQDPPEVILDLVAKWREGYEVVYAVRNSRLGESQFKLWTAALFYRLLRSLTNVDIPLDTGDFRLMDRKVVDAFLQIKERQRFVRGLIPWLGFRQTGVLYDRAPREFGTTHYPFRKMVKFAMDGVCSFSTVPLRGAIYLGLFSAALAIAIGIWALYIKIATNEAIQGWTSVMLVMLFLGGVQLATLGVLGEYLGRTYEEVKQRPLYLIDRCMGFAKEIKPVLHSHR